MPKIIENPERLILEHAKKILTEEGLEHINIRDVAKSSGLAVGTIYNYFPGKEELVAQLVIDYWNDYFIIVERIDQEEKELYAKLRKMYFQFREFVDIFLEVWVRTNNNVIPKYTENGLHRKRDFTEKMIIKIEAIIKGYYQENALDLPSDLTAAEIARFITQNFVMMAHMKQFEYETFEKFLRKILA